jgi:hypothetical protein
VRANTEGREPTPHAGERETAATGAVEAITSQLTRRRLLKSTGPAAIAVGLVWSAPSIRTTVLDPKHAGTPAPTDTTKPPTKVESEGPLEPQTQPVDPGATVVEPSEKSGGSLPFTGTDPKSLLIAGGGAIAAGTAAIAFVRDPEPSRGE